MKAEVEIVTPAMAKDMLEKNGLNRPLITRVARLYASDMKADLWVNNGQGIVISHDGTLLDGQHRLQAIVYANRPISMLVVRGADPDVFKTMDTGKPRRLADVLAIQGHRHTSVVGVVSRVAYCYISNTSQNNFPTKAVLEQFIHCHPYLFDVVNLIAPRARKFPKSALGSVLFLGNDNGNLSEEVTTFVDGILYGEGMWRGDPRLTLREWVAAQRSRDRGHYGILSSETAFAATARAWNAYAAGKELTSLRMLDKPSRSNLPIFGFDPSRYPDVADLQEKRRFLTPKTF